MDIGKLQQFYRESAVARAFMDHASRRERDQSETTVDRIPVVLRAEGHLFERRDIIRLFQALADLGCGQFITGRRGWPSRLVWSAGMRSVGRAAAGAGGSERIALISPDENGDEVSFPMADDEVETETVPEDSDSKEVGELEGPGLEEEKDDPGEGFEITQPFDPARIRVETKPMVISLLMDRIKAREIDLTPGFQRKGGIWNAKAKSQLVESLLIRIPLPAFYMDGSDESKWLVVDGLQRLSCSKAPSGRVRRQTPGHCEVPVKSSGSAVPAVKTALPEYGTGLGTLRQHSKLELISS